MCGFAGVVSTAVVDENVVAEMTATMRHRGPDDGGLWSDSHCALGHRRLAIIDLSVRGHQPMTDDTGQLQLVFNGEIYNFRELRRQLEQRGARFRSDTDGEVILHAYRAWGDEAVERFKGMFSFALWDARQRRLLLVRDRVGKKPLFWAQRGQHLYFSSEMQGLLAVPGLDREVDMKAIEAYLGLGYIPAPSTGFRGINKLQPGNMLSADVTGTAPEVTVRRYWSLQYSPKLRISEREAIAGVRERVREAVRMRLITDVPLGAFLSGGVDSSIVVGLMAQLSAAPVKTFSIGFEDAAFDELPHARRIARLWDTDHHEEVVRPDAVAVVPQLVRHFGEPYADSSALPTYYLAQMARRSVTVALNGDGGDESFAGYDRYRANEVAQVVSRMPAASLVSCALGRALPRSVNPKAFPQRARRFLDVSTAPMSERYQQWIGPFSPIERACLLGGATATAGPLDGLFADAEGLRPADAAMYVDVNSYLPYDLLVKVDIATMAHSLEARSPLLDHEVMEYAALLPISLKLRRGQAKSLLKRAFPELLPAANVKRTKMGFGVPVGEWFRGSLGAMFKETVLADDSQLGSYLNLEFVASLLADHQSRRAENAGRLWCMLMLEMWHREVVTAPRVSAR